LRFQQGESIIIMITNKRGIFFLLLHSFLLDTNVFSP
jgi:hypothetical protein